MTATLFRNGHIVREHDVVFGSLTIVSDEIVDVDGDTQPDLPNRVILEDLDGDYLLPGLIEVHTDALEWHLRPRVESLWPASAAVVGHDAVLAASGITTVLDSLCIGDLGGDGFRADTLMSALAAITETQHRGNFRVDHLLHYRCEVADPRTSNLFEELLENPLLRLVSLMDHTPGGRQYTDLEKYRCSQYKHGRSDREVDDHVQRLQERQAEHSMANWHRIAKIARDRNLPLASHDDATLDDVELAIESGVTISEFPTTELAARAAKSAGMSTAAGAPNVVRGGSHSGNVAAAELARLGLLDIITSDYAPYSLLHAPFVLAAKGVLPLARAVALVTAEPADAISLSDRGRLSAGKRADLVRVRVVDGVPLVRGVYAAGARVA